MSVRYHVSDDLLLAYAAGSLEEGWSLVVATHLALCPDCRGRLALAEAAGAVMMTNSAEPDEAFDEEASWQSLRAMIADIPAEVVEKPEQRIMPTHAVLPLPLRDYVGGDVDSLRWRSLGRGAAQVMIPTSGPTQARLLRIPAGQPVPEHGHGGRELTLVLSGSFRDGTAVYARGDIEDADAELTHQPIATPEADCICLAVTDAPLRFRSWMLRLAQPLLRI